MKLKGFAVVIALATAATSCAPSVSTRPAVNTAAAIGPRFLIGEHSITGAVPGGGLVFTSSYARFVLRDATGAQILGHDAVGTGVGRGPDALGGVGTPAFDAVHRLAYWSRSDAAGAPAFQLRVWDIDTDVDKAVTSVSTRIAYGGPVWSASGALVYATATAATSATRDVELHTVDAAGVDRTILRAPFGASAIAPAWAQGDRVGGLAGHEYQVLATNSGQVVGQYDFGTVAVELSAGDDVVVAIGRPFESAPGPIKVLRAADASRLAEHAIDGLTGAVARPGRTQIVIGHGNDLELFDYATATSRVVLHRAGAVIPIVATSRGRSALIRSGTGYELVDLETAAVVPVTVPNAPTAAVLAVIDPPSGR